MEDTSPIEIWYLDGVTTGEEVVSAIVDISEEGVVHLVSLQKAFGWEGGKQRWSCFPRPRRGASSLRVGFV